MGSMEAGVRLRVFVNGEAVETGAESLAELLDAHGHGEAKVATARNGEFVPRAARAATRLAEGDRIEIVTARAGG